MKIKITVTREANAEYFGVTPGDFVSVELEDYVADVVASEVGNSAVETCKAQAVAARSFAVSKGVLDGAAITDNSSTDQAYRAGRCGSGLYPNAVSGTRQTAGEILTYNGKAINAVYSACNGGRTVASKTRWGGIRPYLIEQDDPWDDSEKRTGHGVGMSQRGAKAMAAAGKTYREILAFYYPGTKLEAAAGAEAPSAGTDNTEGGDRMVSAEAFVEKVKIPLEEQWGYIYKTHGTIWTKEKQAAATREQTVRYGSKWIGRMVTDCSGLIYWACVELGVQAVHHATYLYTDWCKPKGRLITIPENEAGETKGRDDSEPIKPGTLVFIKGTKEKIHHTGVYVGNDTVIEAKGTQSGVVTSRLSHWEYWGELKTLDYSGAGAPEGGEEKMDTTVRAVVSNPNNKLNVRSDAGKQYPRVWQVQKGTIVTVLDMSNPEWWQIEYNGKTGWAASEYLTLQKQPEPTKPEKPKPSYPDIPGWDIDEDDEEYEEYEEPENAAQPDSVDLLGALKGIAADLDILKRLTDDAMKVPSAEALVEILTALDKVLPEIAEETKTMWNLITVG